MINITQKNLYINKENYNTNYNFYNYNKFKLHKKIPITYRSPTIFLDGLYFELKECKIVNLLKHENSMTYILTLEIDIKNKDILNLLKNIETYNINFFKENKDKFAVRLNKSNKLPIFNNNAAASSAEEIPFRSTYTSFKMPVSNPLIINYSYVPFYRINNDKLYMTASIKNNYLFKIVDLLLLNNEDNECIKNLSDIMRTEYFELKSKKLNLILNDIKLNIWLKANNFIGIDKDKIIMDWKICDYNFSK